MAPHAALRLAPRLPESEPTPRHDWRRADILDGVPALAEALRVGAIERELQRDAPHWAFDRIRALGLGTLLLPTTLGGPGGSLIDATQVLVTLAAGDSNVAHSLRSHLSATELWRTTSATPATPFVQRQINRALAGRLFGGGATEVGTQHPGIVTTPLTREGDHYRLNGRKFYATGTAYADYASISAIDESGAPVTAILPVQREGLEIADDWDGMGQRLTASGSLIFHNVRVEADEVAHSSTLRLGLPSRHNSAWRQLVLVSSAAGIVRALAREIEDYVRNKGRAALHSGAERASADPFIQQVVGEISAQSHAIDALVFDNARVLEASAQALIHQSPEAEDLVLAGALATAKTQWVVSRLALQAAERVFEAGGASATARHLQLDRHWRNLRTIFSHNPLQHKARVIGDYHLNGTTEILEAARVF